MPLSYPSDIATSIEKLPYGPFTRFIPAPAFHNAPGSDAATLTLAVASELATAKWVSAAANGGATAERTMRLLCPIGQYMSELAMVAAAVNADAKWAPEAAADAYFDFYVLGNQLTAATVAAQLDLTCSRMSYGVADTGVGTSGDMVNGDFGPHNTNTGAGTNQAWRFTIENECGRGDDLWIVAKHAMDDTGGGSDKIIEVYGGYLVYNIRGNLAA